MTEFQTVRSSNLRFVVCLLFTSALVSCSDSGSHRLSDCTGVGCNRPTCVAGTYSCACDSADLCGAGLTCQSDQTCLAAFEASVSVDSSAVRSCDVLLRVSDGEPFAFRFATQVTGEAIPEGARLSASFLAADAFPGPVMKIALRQSAEAAASPKVEVVDSTCFDRLGQPLLQTALRID